MEVTITLQIDHTEPHLLSAKDVGAYLTAVETMLVEQAASTHDRLNRDDLRLSLSSIKDKCVQLSFKPNLPDPIYQAYNDITDALIHHRHELLADKVLRPLRNIQEFDQKHGCQTLFMAQQGDRLVAKATLPKLRSDMDSFFLNGGTNLYGRVERVGGVTEPKVSLKVSGKTISCKTTEALAQEIAPYLYKEVGVKGVAKWNAETMALESFTIQALLPYRKATITDAFKALRDAAGGALDDVHAIDYVNEIRG